MGSTGTSLVAGLGCVIGIWILAHPGPGDVVPPLWQQAACVVLVLLGGFVLSRIIRALRKDV